MSPRVARLPFIAIILLHIFVPLHSVQTISSCSINSNIVSMRNISSFYIRSTTSAAEPNASFAYFALVDSSGNKLYEHGGSEFVAPTASPHVPATAIAGTDYEYMRFTYDSGTDVDGQTLYNLMFAQEMECDVLIVAGGGGGGKSGSFGSGGGGGAGGLLYYKRRLIPAGEYAVRVGKGGQIQEKKRFVGYNGKPSQFSYLNWTANGGGGGGGNPAEPEGQPASGGSGGGGGTHYTGNEGLPACSGVLGQGHDGGVGDTTKANSGGGGGAGGPGQDATSFQGGNGGPGREIDIIGSVGIFYAGGGGGGSGADPDSNVLSPGSAQHGAGNGGRHHNSEQEEVHESGSDAEPHTGGGGGGAGGAGYGGAGGSGVVIVRYRVS